MDALAKSIERNREFLRIVIPERSCVWAQVFYCCVCKKQRPVEQRRDRNSDVCVKCVAAAGFNED